MAIYVFAIELRWLPSGGMFELGEEGDLLSLLRHLVLPTLVLALVITATWSRYARSAFLEVLGQDFMRTARAKGLPLSARLWRHALPQCRQAADRPAGRGAALPLLRRAGDRDHLRLARHGAALRRCAGDEGISGADGADDVHRRFSSSPATCSPISPSPPSIPGYGYDGAACDAGAASGAASVATALALGRRAGRRPAAGRGAVRPADRAAGPDAAGHAAALPRRPSPTLPSPSAPTSSAATPSPACSTAAGSR